MTAHRDDHILVLERFHTTGVKHEIICPYTGTPERRIGKCGLLTTCGCQDDYDEDVRLWEALTGEGGPELELHDWLEGCYENLALGEDGKLGFQYTTAPRSSIHITVQGHRACPRHSPQEHDIWEGELHVQGTECSYQELLDGYGVDMYSDQITEAGRYAISIAWQHEEWEFTMIEKVA